MTNIQDYAHHLTETLAYWGRGWPLAINGGAADDEQRQWRSYIPP